MTITPGQWSFMGMNIPDFGWTEKNAPALGVNPFQPPAPNSGASMASWPQYTNPTPTTQPVQKSSPIVTTGGVKTNPPPAGFNINEAQGANVGDQRNGMRWNGVQWEPLGGGGGGQDDSLQREIEARNATIRNNINSGYDQYSSNLDQISNMYPTMQANDEKLAGDTYNSMFGGIQEGQTLANQKLDLSKQNVLTQGKNSISDLSSNLRNMLKASSAQLGAMGAGSSSASPMAAYAYSKIAAHERGGIQKQINDQLMQVDQKVVDVQTTFNSQKMELEQWKGTQLQGIRDKYLPMVTRIKEMKASVPLEKVQALNQLETGLLSRAQNELSQIESEGRQFAMNMQSQAQTQLSNLTALKLQLANNSNFDPQSIVFNQMNAMNGPQQKQDSYNYTNPWAVKKNPWDTTK
jgi:hypothetical protein